MVMDLKSPCTHRAIPQGAQWTARVQEAGTKQPHRSAPNPPTIRWRPRRAKSPQKPTWHRAERLRGVMALHLALISKNSKA